MRVVASIIFPNRVGGRSKVERLITSPKGLMEALEEFCTFNSEFLRQNPRLPDIYKAGVRYESEPPGQEDWLTYPVLLEDKVGDCLPLSTLVLRDDYEFVPLGQLTPGTRIMGHGGFTTVTDIGVTGEKTILAFELGNGAVLRSSPEHRLFLADGIEVRAEDVKVGQHLLTGCEFPVAGNQPYQPKFASPASGLAPNELAWLIGIYIADGWSEVNRFGISGKDGKPKEAQKLRVKELLAPLGISMRWHERYLSVMDRGFTEFLVQCGGLAPTKRIPTLALSQEQILAILEGLKADGYTTSSGSFIYGTTSQVLALQLRVLHRMIGQSVHIKRWDDHGGLGTHPIYRIGVRTKDDARQRSAKVLSIRELPEELCGDITKDQGRFWLPESDLIVHNCEDLACARVAKLRQRGEHGAKPYLYHKNRLWHVMVQRGDGRIEDPSAVLGMYNPRADISGLSPETKEKMAMVAGIHRRLGMYDE